jgi:hypothetical protein
VQQDRLEYFQAMLDKQIDLVDRRLLQGEVIAAGEKIRLCGVNCG